MALPERKHRRYHPSENRSGRGTRKIAPVKPICNWGGQRRYPIRKFAIYAVPFQGGQLAEHPIKIDDPAGIRKVYSL